MLPYLYQYEHVLQVPPEQLLQEEEPDEVPPDESVLKPIGANIFTIFRLPHFLHFISEPLSPRSTISEISWQSSHL